MNAQELRIGNWLHSNLTEMDFRVTSRDILNIEGYPNTCKPIPLTEEWLLKFGFEKAPLVDKYLKGYFTYDSKLKYFTYFTDIEDGGYENIIIQKEKLKYVHQLQNIYFALIGEELILKN